MKKIKLGLDEKTVSQKLKEGRDIAPELIADADTDVVAVGNELKTVSTTLRDKDTEKSQLDDDAKAATIALNNTEDSWDDVMRRVAAKVMEKYPNNPEKWTDYGFELSADKSSHKPNKVKNVSINFGDVSKQADVTWDKPEYALTYKIQINEGDPTNEKDWKFANPDSSTRCSVTVIELNAGKQTWFRVCGFNANGNGVWSDPIGRIIP